MEISVNKTTLGVKTAVTVIITSLIQGVLTFVRTRTLILTYGDDINGVIQVALQMSAYLTLIQNGMSAAYRFKMYRPAAGKGFLIRFQVFLLACARICRVFPGKCLSSHRS